MERWYKRVEGNVSDCQARCLDHWTLTESVSTCERNRESGWRDPLHSTRRKPRLARRQFCRGRPAIPVKSSRHHRLVKLTIRDPAPFDQALTPAIIPWLARGRGRQAWTAASPLALAKLSRSPSLRLTPHAWVSSGNRAARGNPHKPLEVHGIDMRSYGGPLGRLGSISRRHFRVTGAYTTPPPIQNAPLKLHDES